jgi:hypothetical protein
MHNSSGGQIHILHIKFKSAIDCDTCRSPSFDKTKSDIDLAKEKSYGDGLLIQETVVKLNVKRWGRTFRVMSYGMMKGKAGQRRKSVSGSVKREIGQASSNVWLCNY